MSASTPWLLTGVTGGLGAKILHDLLHVHKISTRDIIVTARTESKRESYESEGLQFRVLDYGRPETLSPALEGVANFLFTSSPERNSELRIAHQTNVIEAAKAQGVKKVWYVSLAFGGYGDGSKIGFQAAHYATEDKLKHLGLDFVSLRAGIYSDAFPLFLNWYPSSTKILLPRITPPVTDSQIAFSTREELGEAIATLVAKGLEGFPSIQPQTEKNIILLTGSHADSIVDLVHAISRATGNEVPIEYWEPEDWVAESAKDDEGGKPKAWFEARLIFMQGVAQGDAATISPALATLLGREPESGSDAVHRLVKENPGYTWHQNHVNTK